MRKLPIIPAESTASSTNDLSESRRDLNSETPFPTDFTPPVSLPTSILEGIASTDEGADAINITPSEAFDTENLPSDSAPLSLTTLHHEILKSTDKLFFVSYMPAGTMRPRWYLVQVGIDDSPSGKNTGTYFCSFLQRHPSDSNKSDSISRW